MSPDLAALTEAVAERLPVLERTEYVAEWPADEQAYARDFSAWSDFTARAAGLRSMRRRKVAEVAVRAVLEALPREWGYQVENRIDWDDVWSWTRNRGTPEARVASWNFPGIGCRLVWRAVGPPIPAEEGA